MRLLLDTHAFLWVLEASARLSPKARAAIQDAGNVKLVSFASLWEITIKVAFGKLKLETPWEETLRQIERMAPGTVLGCTVPHLESLSQLPHHHRDPFDRMLVAQARADDLTLVSHDDLLDAYGIRRLW
jgi:PIN domain nuclease of toxin-antitoxin system